MFDLRQEHYPPPSHVKPPHLPIVSGARAPRKWTGTLPDKFVAALVTRVAQANLETWVNDLSAFHTRHTKSAYIEQVADWIVNRFHDFGYTDVVKHPYTKNGYQLHNVVCTKPGAGNTGQVTILCAHYDCVMEDETDAAARAPGADDNASGVAALLELARILAEVQLRDNVRFVAFSGEEQGLWGAAAYAEYVKTQNLDVRRVINLDMIGQTLANSGVIVEYDTGNVMPSNDQGSKNLADVMAEMAADYCGTTVSFGPAYGSDYMPFEALGYVIAGVYEGEGNPHYHTHTDTPSTVNFACAADVTRMVLGSVFHETASVMDESGSGVDLYIRDNQSDDGMQPSGADHWSSPDIWVRNNPPPADPNDATDPNYSEKPDDGHQPPINQVPNYLYVKVHNRGVRAAPAGAFSVEAFHCDPATSMIWPTDFHSMGMLQVADAIPAGGGSARVGPFVWTPQIVDHECLLAIVSGPGDHAIRDFYSGTIEHALLVRFDNNTGQRNVTPVASTPGGKTTTSFLMRGTLHPSVNTLRLHAEELPPDTEILVRVARGIIANAAGISGFASNQAKVQWSILKLNGGGLGTIERFPLSSNEVRTVTLEVNFSCQAEHLKRYRLVAVQEQNDAVVGQIAIEITAVKECEDYVYGNRRSRELHILNCPYRKTMSRHNQVPFVNVQDALVRGYNGCAFCLPQFDMG